MPKKVALFVALVLGLGALSPLQAHAASDGDGDGMSDRWERRHGLDPARSNAGGDPDRDGLTNIQELQLRTHPRDADTDGDEVRDGREVRKWGSSPRLPDALVGLVHGEMLCDADGTDCADRPLGGAVFVLRGPDGTEVDRAISDVFGRFSMQASSGTYTFEALDAPGLDAPEPSVFEYEGAAARAVVGYGQQVSRGIVGQVTQGPTCPVEREFESCVAPVEGASVHVHDAAGQEVAGAMTDEGGRYGFSLLPGEYTLTADPLGEAAFPAPPEPVTFTITAEELYPRVFDLSYDTGIR